MKYRIAVILALLLLSIPQVAFAQDNSAVDASAAGVAATNLSETASSSEKSVDAIRIKLIGSIADAYDIVYRTHVQIIGWQRHLHNKG